MIHWTIWLTTRFRPPPPSAHVGSWKASPARWPAGHGRGSSLCQSQKTIELPISDRLCMNHKNTRISPQSTFLHHDHLMTIASNLPKTLGSYLNCRTRPKLYMHRLVRSFQTKRVRSVRRGRGALAVLPSSYSSPCRFSSWYIMHLKLKLRFDGFVFTKIFSCSLASSALTRDWTSNHRGHHCGDTVHSVCAHLMGSLMDDRRS